MSGQRFRAARALLSVFLGLSVCPPARADIQVTAGWSRATVPGASVGVGYMVVTNTGTERRTLLRITSPVCDTVMLHQSSIDANGLARMWPVASLALGPGEAVRFEPNGRHVMFSDLNSPFMAGTTVPLTLEFDGGEKAVTVQLEVRPLVPDAAPAAGHAHH